MNAREFSQTAMALLRSAVGWQSAIARRLDVDRKTVQRWLKADEVPAWAAEKLAEMIGAADISAWPRDEWMIGDTRGQDGKYREYIAHLQPPRFVARIVATDLEGMAEIAEEPADLISGTVYTTDDAVLCEIAWIDEIAPGEIVKWLEAAADEIERHSGE